MFFIIYYEGAHFTLPFAKDSEISVRKNEISDLIKNMSLNPISLLSDLKQMFFLYDNLEMGSTSLCQCKYPNLLLELVMNKNKNKKMKFYFKINFDTYPKYELEGKMSQLTWLLPEVADFIRIKNKYNCLIMPDVSKYLLLNILKNKIITKRLVSFLVYKLVKIVERLHSQQMILNNLDENDLVLTKDYDLKIRCFGYITSYKQFDPLYPVKIHKNGSLEHFSPEKIYNSSVKVNDLSKVDIYLVASVLHKIIFGKIPYNNDNEQQLDITTRKSQFEYYKLQLPTDCDEIIRDFMTRSLKIEVRDRLDVYEAKKTQIYLYGEQIETIRLTLSKNSDFMELLFHNEDENIDEEMKDEIEF